MVGKLFKAAFSFIFIANCICLCIAILSPYIDPALFWPPAIFGLLFKVFLLVEILFVILFVFSRMWKMVLLGILMILLAWGSISKTLALRSQETEIVDSSAFKIMTWNVKNFSYYQDQSIMDSIFSVLEREDPDLFFIQEYYYNNRFGNPSREKFRKRFPYFNEYKIHGGWIKNYFRMGGLAIMSKYKLGEINAIDFENTSNGAFYTDLQLGGKNYRLINAHLQSYRLHENDYALPKEIDSVELSQFKAGVIKLKDAFIMRSRQVAALREVIDASPYPVILCGDFNDSPVSFCYRQIAEKLNDAFIASGAKMGSTFAGKIPFQRIDYIFTDTSIITGNCHVIKKECSDHFPIVCTLLPK